MHKRYGDVVHLRALGRFHWYVLTHPDDVEHVLRTHGRNYVKPPRLSAQFALLLGQGLLTAEGAHWLRQRRLAQPAFHRPRLLALGRTMTDAAEETAGRWEEPARNGAPLDVATEMSQLALRIVGRALFSTDVSGQTEAVGSALATALNFVEYRIRHPFALPVSLPLPRNVRFQRAKRAFDEIVYGMIEERRRTTQDTGDLLSMLLAARDEETGEGMSDEQVRDESLTILLAGHETTAVALSWTWYELSRHPEVEARLHAELDRVLGGRTPTVEDLQRLPYTRMVLDESLRLYPPAWGMARQSREEDELPSGYRLPADTPLSLVQYITHRHPDYWEEPDRFAPERFEPARSAGRPPFAYFPFGGGQRQCIGSNFALMEAQLVLATLAQRYTLKLVPGHPVEPEPIVTLRPRHGLRMTLRQRREGA
jgi:cytochrome P450